VASGLQQWQTDSTKNQNTKHINIFKTMNTLEMKGNWNVIKGKLKQRWARLTDDDLRYVDGKEDELIGRIQKRTGETREAVEKVLDETCTSCCSHD